MIPMSLSFEDYLTCDYGEQWASPIDLRYLFDGLAIWPGGLAPIKPDTCAPLN